MNLVIEKLNCEQVESALKLSFTVFMECGSSDYDEEGVATFYRFIHDKEHISMLTMYGAFMHDVLVGVIGTKNKGSHISLFFVNSDYQGYGIGRRLFEFAQADTQADYITVNSSTYAVKIYEKLGFVQSGEPQIKSGLKSVPMVYGK